MGLFKGLYVITDCENLSFEITLERTKQILECGVPFLQYRDKTADDNLRRDRALALLALCREYKTLFLINDDVRLAAAIGADGAHIGKDDISYKDARRVLGDQSIIGVSCYNQLERAQTAQAQGTDYVAFGAFYSSQTKSGTVKAEAGLLKVAREMLSIPIVAIGGITPENGEDLVRAGANMLAVVSSLYKHEYPQSIVLKYKEIFSALELE